MHVLIQGAGRGIGLSLAQQARASGATKLFLTARNPQESPGYASLPPDANTIWMKLDATRPETIADTAAIVADNTDRLDRVICTAGILQEGTIRPEKRIQDIDAATLTHVFQTNAPVPVLLAREIWPLLRGAHQLHFAALSARVGSISDNHLGGWYAYRASKAALNQLMRTLSIELARANPNACVATLHPGTVDTGLSRPFQANVPKDELFTASKGEGAWLNGTQRLATSGKVALAGGFMATGMPMAGSAMMGPSLATFGNVLNGCSGVRQWGAAALDLAYVGAGRLDGYWNTRLKLWHYVAGMLVVTEAGGSVAPVEPDLGLGTGGLVGICSEQMLADFAKVTG